MEEKVLTLPEVCKEISADLKSRRITQKAAAEMMGTTKQTVANQLSGKKRFSANMAEKFHDKLGYSLEFLLYGRGEMYAPGRLIWHPRPGTFPELLGRVNDPIMTHSSIMRRCEHILEIINDKVAMECFEKAYEGEWDESDELMDILTDRYSWDVPVMTSNPKATKAFRYMREYFRTVEVEAAKELVQIEQKAALGEIVDVDALVDRFRKRVIWIKDSHKDQALEKHPELNLDEYVTKEELADMYTLTDKKPKQE